MILILSYLILKIIIIKLITCIKYIRKGFCGPRLGTDLRKPLDDPLRPPPVAALLRERRCRPLLRSRIASGTSCLRLSDGCGVGFHRTRCGCHRGLRAQLALAVRRSLPAPPLPSAPPRRPPPPPIPSRSHPKLARTHRLPTPRPPLPCHRHRDTVPGPRSSRSQASHRFRLRGIFRACLPCAP